MTTLQAMIQIDTSSSSEFRNRRRLWPTRASGFMQVSADIGTVQRRCWQLGRRGGGIASTNRSQVVYGVFWKINNGSPGRSHPPAWCNGANTVY
jgi:hypothetical protein